jgi:hypothetical protein
VPSQRTPGAVPKKPLSPHAGPDHSSCGAPVVVPPAPRGTKSRRHRKDSGLGPPSRLANSFCCLIAKHDIKFRRTEIHSEKLTPNSEHVLCRNGVVHRYSVLFYSLDSFGYWKHLYVLSLSLMVLARCNARHHRCVLGTTRDDAATVLHGTPCPSHLAIGEKTIVCHETVLRPPARRTVGCRQSLAVVWPLLGGGRRPLRPLRGGGRRHCKVGVPSLHVGILRSPGDHRLLGRWEASPGS